MAVLTKLTRRVVESILEDYDVGVLQDMQSTSYGIENTNYFVSTSRDPHQGDTSEFVLTMIEVDRLAQQDLMLQALETCYDHGLPVPYMVNTRSGSKLSTYRGKSIMLAKRIQGNHVFAPVRRQCGAIGRFLARMHLTTTSVNATESQSLRDENWLRSHANSLEEHLDPSQTSLLWNAVETVESCLQRGDVQRLPQGVIHGDMFRDNALFNEHGLAGALDFYHVARGYWLYDLAVAINDWCRTHDELDYGRTIALLKEYNSIRPIEEKEYWFFPIFLLYGALSFWLSRLRVYVRKDLPEGYPVKDPYEFEYLVRRHHSRPFRLHRLALTS